MSDLISRQAAIELIESEYRRWGEEYGISDVLCDLDDMPAAEPRKGKWVCSDDMYETAICACCKCDSGEAWANAKRWFNYCPNCGARMEESV